jgi:hypothetical protein
MSKTGLDNKRKYGLENTQGWIVQRIDNGFNCWSQMGVLNRFKLLSESYQYVLDSLDESIYRVKYFDCHLKRTVNFFPDVGNEPKLY